MKSFKVGQRHWENFIFGKRNYLLTSDSDVEKGLMRCITSGGTIAELNVTDIVAMQTSSGVIYIVSCEVERVWL